MRTPRSQPLPLQIYPRQLPGEVSPHAPPSPLSFTHSGSASSQSLRFSDPKLCHNSSLHRKCQSKHTVDRLIRSQRDFTT
jgi:hypothetical protein